MEPYRKRLTLQTLSHNQIMDITDVVTGIIRESGIQNGLVNVFHTHISGAIIITTDEAGLHRDIQEIEEKLAPKDSNYSHRQPGEEPNAHAHLRSVLFAVERTMPVAGGAPALGEWQRVYFCEFDKPHKREVIVTVVGE